MMSRSSLVLFLLLVLDFPVFCEQAPAGQEAVVEQFRAAQADMQANRFPSAIEHFRKVLQLDPGLIEARVNLGLAYHALGDYSQAVVELGQAAKQRPDILPASLFLGLSYLKLGSSGKAIAPLDHALALDASNREARRALATAELAEGDYGRAAAEFRRLASTEADPAEAQFRLGQDYLEMAKQLTTELSTQFRDPPGRCGWVRAMS